MAQVKLLKPDQLPSIYEAQLCPVCGHQLDFKPWDGGCSSHEICPGCGIHFGYDDACGGQGLAARKAVYLRWRAAWESNGRQRWSKRMKTITTIEELSAATAADRAVLFLDVAWSGTAVRSRPVVSALEQEWCSDNARPAVSFYRVDVSDQEGPVWAEVRLADRAICSCRPADLWRQRRTGMDPAGFGSRLGQLCCRRGCCSAC
jgi:hypothetical protein